MTARGEWIVALLSALRELRVAIWLPSLHCLTCELGKLSQRVGVGRNQSSLHGTI